jgi:hypothetical protein
MRGIYLYPVVIYEDRYGGTYSGGRWLAVAQGDNPERNLFLTGAYDGDSEASFWGSNLPKWVGVGATPNDALEDLRHKSGGDQREFDGQEAANALAASIRAHRSSGAAETGESGGSEASRDEEDGS